jgi:hypothetical protein
MIKLIKSLLGIQAVKPQNEPLLIPTQTEQAHSYLTSSIDKNGDISLKCFWPKDCQTDEMAENYAYMLNELSTGEFNGIILRAFQNGVDNGFVTREFILKVYDNWQAIKKQSEVEPIIKPTEVFGGEE